MSDRLSRLESRVEEMARAIGEIERRLGEVERGKPVSVPREDAAPSASPPAPAEADLTAAIAFFGRTLLALGGAYLLRALTEADTLPPGLGIPLGFAYALSFAFLAHRAAALGKSASAAFHCGAAAAIGYPLLWETTVRLRFLDPPASAFAALVFTLALLFVAWRWSLPSAAWLIHLAAIATSFALIGGTRTVAPYAAGLVAFGLASLWLGYSRDLPVLQWLSAAAADLAVLLLALGMRIQKGVASPELAMSVLILFFLGYLGSFFRRNLVEGRAGSVFEMVQASVATLAGYGLAVTSVDRPGTARLASVIGIGAAAACILGGLGRLSIPRLPSERNRLFYLTLALPIALFATASVPGRPYLWSAAGVAAYVAGARSRCIEMSLHGGAYLFAAAAAGGLLARVGYAFAAPAGIAWPGFSLESSIPLAAAIASCAVAVPERASGRAWERLPKALRLLIAILGAGAAAVFFLAPPVAGQGGPEIDAGALAALRTALLSVAAVGLAALGGLRGFREALLLLYPLLVLTGIKVVLEDFRLGRAETIFAGLAFYGTALILATRLARSGRGASSSERSE